MRPHGSLGYQTLVPESMRLVPATIGGLIILVSADHAFWVEDLAGVSEIMADRFADREATSRELWLRGTASPRLVAEVAVLDRAPRRRSGGRRKAGLT